MHSLQSKVRYTIQWRPAGCFSLHSGLPGYGGVERAGCLSFEARDKTKVSEEEKRLVITAVRNLGFRCRLSDKAL